MNEVPNASAPLVVYVDDERPNRIVFEQSLKSEFRIKAFGDARSALDYLAQDDDVAVLVTDIRMPDIDGLELLSIAKERHPDTIKMVITAYSDIDPILRAINQGLVARYIIKPFERDELQQCLRWATELWALRKSSPELVNRMLETERLATLGALTAMYLHDVRTPLTTATLLLDALPTTSEEQQQVDDLPELVGDIKEATAAVSGMVGDLWGFIRPPKTQAERPSIDPLHHIRHTIGMYKKLSSYSGSRIEYIGPTELPNVRMSPTALTQVMLNIIGNGAQAVIARKEADRGVEIDARPAGDMLEVQVRDEGVGMAPEVLRRIGTPFFTTRAEGTGLGVANVQRLVGGAGGRMKIESEQGVGTTVTLLLPIAV